MKKNLKKLNEELQAVLPAGRRLPISDIEWLKLQRAAMRLSTALLRNAGVSKANAKELSEQTFGCRLGCLAFLCMLEGDQS